MRRSVPARASTILIGDRCDRPIEKLIFDYSEGSLMQQTRILVACIAIVSSGMAMAQPPFPRIATVNFSAPQNYDSPAVEAQLAKYNIALLSIWPGWIGAGGKTMNQSIQGVKAINPQTKVFFLINNNEKNIHEAAEAPFVNKLDEMHWWLYPSGTSGTPVTSVFPGATEINNTLFTHPDSNGDTWVSWYAKYAAQNYSVPNPAADGLITDNVFWRPRVNGDWNLNGVTDSDTNPTVGEWYRQGYAQHFAVLKQQMLPGKYVLGNVTDWGVPGADLSYYTGVLNGGLIEGMIGQSWSPETYLSWSAMMREYRVVMASVVSPTLVVFSQQGVANDYQAFRYGFASCLMDDGYYNFTLAANNYSGFFWFDEFNASLGNSLAGPSTTAWQNGVYRRDFQNGIALVNPRGNGVQTVQLETAYVKIKGSQAPAVNNGQTVQTVTLQDRDGIILMRTGAPASSGSVPAPPAGVTVH
jgi:hypothetical protein